MKANELNTYNSYLEARVKEAEARINQSNKLKEELLFVNSSISKIQSHYSELKVTFHFSPW